MPNPKSKLWTIYEEEHMRSLTAKYNWSRISTMLGRTHASVVRKAQEIGCYREGPRWMSSERGIKLAILRGSGVSFADISKLMGTSIPSCQKAFVRNRDQVIDLWRAALIAECSGRLRDMGLSEKTILKFEESMQDAFVPRMDLISAVKTIPELAEALKSLSEDVDANT